MQDDRVAFFQFCDRFREHFSVGHRLAVDPLDDVALAQRIFAVGGLDIRDKAVRADLFDDKAFLPLELITGGKRRREFGQRQPERLRLGLWLIDRQLCPAAVLIYRDRRTLGEPERCCLLVECGAVLSIKDDAHRPVGRRCLHLGDQILRALDRFIVKTDDDITNLEARGRRRRRIADIGDYRAASFL